MAKHGAEAHFLRPDGVYITTVLQPTLDFDPVRDTASVAARFVAPMGLAGPVATRHHLNGQVNLLGATPTWRERWFAFKARVKANMAASKLMREMRVRPMLPAAMPAQDLPRPPNADPTALMAKGAWAPQPQTKLTAAQDVVNAVSRAGDPPNQSAANTAVAMAPQQAAWPGYFWQRSIHGDPAVVDSRAGQWAMNRWWADRGPTTGSR